MPIDRILNELSFDSLAKDVYEARSRMTRLVDLLVGCTQQQVTGDFRVPENYWQLPLAENYNFHNWLNDVAADRDARLYMRRQATRSPFLVGLDVLQDVVRAQECHYQGELAQGCHTAHLLDGLCLSLDSAPHWRTSRLSVLLSLVDDDGDLTEEPVLIVHASVAEHLRDHQEWIRSRNAIQIAHGNELWAQRQVLFPNLIFCGDTEGQLRALRHNDPMLDCVIKGLAALHEAALAWSMGGFDYQRIQGRVSDESQSTLNRFADQRRFRCDGETESRLFSWHYKIGLQAWRIHFCASDEAIGVLRVGYIGKHLPTGNDPH